MALLRNDKLNLLSNSITEVTEGRSFVSWAESIAQILVNETSHNRNEVDLNKILSKRNIVIQESNNNPYESYKANLVNKETYYELYLNPSKINSSIEKRFILAHEIAHTLFYTNSNDGLNKRISLSFGSKQIENICDYIALCLILPQDSIEYEINNFISEKDTIRKRNENYFKFVFHLAAKYQVDWHYTLYRLINRFNFLQNSLLIEFIMNECWCLKWVYQTDDLLDRNLFIPVKSKSDKKYVSAKKCFVNIIDLVKNQSNADSNPYGSLVIPKSNFDSNYQGNIKQFFARHFTHDFDIVKIYYRINKSDSILILFPFAGLLR